MTPTRQRPTFLRVAAWIASFPMLILSIAAVGVTIIDLTHLFGWQVLPRLPETATAADDKIYDSIKVVVLLLGLFGGTIAADRIMHFQTVEDDLSHIRRDLASLISDARASATVLSSRAEFYSAFLSALSSAPHGARVFVTSYEKMKMPWTSGEAIAERELMRMWDQRIEDGSLDVEQLVHVASQHDLVDAQKRAETHKTRANYALSVLVGVLPDPFMELVIIDDHTTILVFSSQASSPYASDFGLQIRSGDFANLMARNFRMWSAKFGTALKTRDSFEESVAARLTPQLPEAHALDLPGDLASAALRSARDSHTYEWTAKLADAIDAVRAIDEELYDEALLQLLDSTLLTAQELGRGKITSRTDGLSQLPRMIKSANSSIRAVCPQEALGFWNTPIGARVLETSREAVRRHVKITRIFLVDDPSVLEAQELAVLDAQVAAGIDVLVVSRAEVGRHQVSDYMLVDELFVFEDFADGLDQNYVIDRSKTRIRDFTKHWDALTQVAANYTPASSADPGTTISHP